MPEPVVSPFRTASVSSVLVGRWTIGLDSAREGDWPLCHPSPSEGPEKAAGLGQTTAQPCATDSKTSYNSLIARRLLEIGFVSFFYSLVERHARARGLPPLE